MNAITPQPPFQPVNMGAGGNPNTVDLAVTYAFSEHPENAGMPFILAEYELTDAEIERIKTDKRIRIAIMGTRMSPILPFVETPEELGFYPADLTTGHVLDPRKYPIEKPMRSDVGDGDRKRD